MAETQFNMALRNYAGVPVLELIGRVDKKTITAAEEILDKLISAGHYNLMLNLKRAAWSTLNDLLPLKKIVGDLSSHYGKLDVIVEQHQFDLLYGEDFKSLTSLFRFCTSESQALMRIKRLPGVWTDAVKPTPARLAESM